MQNISVFFILLVHLVKFSYAQNQKILTKSEQKWLADHPKLKASLFEYIPPYQFINHNGEIQGLYVDYLELIEKKINYKFERVTYKEDEWPKILDDAKKGNLDLIIEIQKTEERESFLTFFDPLFDAEISLITRKNEFKNLKYEDIYNKAIVIPKDYMLKDLLLKKFPNLNLNFEKNETECLKLLNNGKYDVYIGIKASTVYFIENNKLDNLSIRASSPIKYKPTIAVTKKNKELSKIIKKAVKDISIKEREVIFNKWLLKKSWPFYYNPNFWFIIITIVLLGLSSVLIFNWRLKKILNQKTKDLRTAFKEINDSNALKTNFINNISHEVRTPMNAILGYAELSKSEFNINTKQQEYLNNIIKSGNQLLNTIDSILEVSKLKSNNFKLKKEEICLDKFLKNIINNFNNVAQEKGIEITYLSFQKKQKVTIDKNRLKKAIVGIIDNAIKFTSNGKVKILHGIFNNNLEIIISDTGIGIDENHKIKIFESFYQLEKNNNNKTGGLGLGLTIAKENINAMNGIITLDSEKNKGSTFKITIPLN